MLRGYSITYKLTNNNSNRGRYTYEYTQFFHLSGRYSWFPYQIGQQQVGNLAIPIHIKKMCLYDVRDFIGPIKGREL